MACCKTSSPLHSIAEALQDMEMLATSKGIVPLMRSATFNRSYGMGWEVLTRFHQKSLALVKLDAAVLSH